MEVIEGLKLKIKCHICSKSYVYRGKFYSHLAEHISELVPEVIHSNVKQEPEYVIECKICDQVFSNSENIIEHCKKDHPSLLANLAEFGYSIDLATLETLNSIDLEILPEILSFVELHECHSLLRCEFCDVAFNGDDMASDIKSFKHMIRHNPSRGYDCGACDVSKKTLPEILLHRESECVYSVFRDTFDLSSYYTCNVCQKRFSSVQDLYYHRFIAMHYFPRYNYETDLLELNCDMCGYCEKTTDTKFTVHYITQHAKQIKAVMMPKKVKVKREQVFTCDICKKGFAKKAHIKQHIQFHLIAKPFPCTYDDCAREFGTRADLNDHINKVHTRARPYICQYCGKRFKSGPVYYQHRLIHYAERRHKCNICGNAFYRGDALKNHKRIHTGEKPYPCPICDRPFRQKNDCKKHVLAIHKTNPADLTFVKKVYMPPILVQTNPLTEDIHNITSEIDIVENKATIFADIMKQQNYIEPRAIKCEEIVEKL